MNKKDLIEKLNRQGFDPAVVKAFEKVDRTNFVLGEYRDKVYADTALPIGRQQTISQPSTIAFMLDQLEVGPHQRILEVGSGSGYVLALLAEMAPKAEIYGTERVPDLAERSREKLANYDNVKVEFTPNKLGLPEKAPFSRILVSAAATELPKALIGQLAGDGIMICPVNNSIEKYQKTPSGPLIREFPGFAFVKLYQDDIST